MLTQFFKLATGTRRSLPSTLAALAFVVAPWVHLAGPGHHHPAHPATGPAAPCGHAHCRLPHPAPHPEPTDRESPQPADPQDDSRPCVTCIKFHLGFTLPIAIAVATATADVPAQLSPTADRVVVREPDPSFCTRGPPSA